MGNKLIIGISAAALAAGVGLGATQLANAETTTPTPSVSPTPGGNATDDTTTDGSAGGEHGHHGARMGIDLSGLAAKLGVTEADLETAVKAARKASSGEEKPTASPTDAERTARQEAFAKALAEELGIDEQKVSDAIAELRSAAAAERAATQKERLDRAVTDGSLTQAEADAVAKALEEGIVTLRGGHR